MSKPGTHPLDPRGLIREAYQIEGIGPEDCRSIFFDWAMGLAVGIDPGEAAMTLRAEYATGAEDHPMTALLDEAIRQASTGVRPSRRRRNRHNGSATD